MSRTITFADAAEQGIIQKGHYFVTVMSKDRKIILNRKETGYRPQELRCIRGAEKLWRLETGLKLWGEPTKEKLILKGKTGFEQGIYTIDRVAREMYELPNVFEACQSLALPQKEYEGLIDYLWKVMQVESEKYKNPDDIKMSYWLASCSNRLDREYDDHSIFYVSMGGVGSNTLYRSNGYAWRTELPVRPEAIPKPIILLETDGLDGSREKPWRFLG